MPYVFTEQGVAMPSINHDEILVLIYEKIKTLLKDYMKKFKDRYANTILEINDDKSLYHD